MPPRVLEESTGVDTPMAGRLRAAGSMSGMMDNGVLATMSRAAEGRRATGEIAHELHITIAGYHAT